MGDATTAMLTPAGCRLTCGPMAAAVVSLVVVASALHDDSALGAPAAWPWLLTGVQVVA